MCQSAPASLSSCLPTILTHTCSRSSDTYADVVSSLQAPAQPIFISITPADHQSFVSSVDAELGGIVLTLACPDPAALPALHLSTASEVISTLEATNSTLTSGRIVFVPSSASRVRLTAGGAFRLSLASGSPGNCTVAAAVTDYAAGALHLAMNSSETSLDLVFETLMGLCFSADMIVTDARCSV
jgi:hypothetical protein